MQLRPDADGVAALERAVPVSLRLTLEDGETVDTWPVWPYQQAALRLLLAGRRDPKILAATGSLGVADDEVAALLDELDAALMIDGTSLWRVAKRPTATALAATAATGRELPMRNWTGSGCVSIPNSPSTTPPAPATVAWSRPTSRLS